MDEDVYTLAIVTAISFLLLWTVTSSLQNLVESAAAAWSRYRNFRGNRRLEGSISLGVRPSMDSHKVPRTSRIALGLRSLSWFNRALVVSSSLHRSLCLGPTHYSKSERIGFETA
jgi:hypothetical protein